MIVTTTPSIEGRTVRTYLCVISSETIIGANFIKDFGFFVCLCIFSHVISRY